MRPPTSWPPGGASWLSPAASLGILQGLEAAVQISGRLKWPNDVLLAGKKVAGVLINTSLGRGGINWAVVGVGINVNNRLPKALRPKATSLSQALGKPVDPTAVLKGVLGGLFDIYDKLCVQGFEAIRPLYKDKLIGIGRVLTLQTGGRTVRGLALDVDPDGNLLVKYRDKARPFRATEAHLTGTLLPERAYKSI